jgi:hypothetical protein
MPVRVRPRAPAQGFLSSHIEELVDRIARDATQPLAGSSFPVPVALVDSR